MKKVVIEGGSKQFFLRDARTYVMAFKDQMHGASRSGQIAGTGHLRQAFTYFFYRYLEQNGIVTHLTADSIRDDGIVVKALMPIKLEIIVRNVARGHWVDEHKIPLFHAGEVFDTPIIEFCLKWKTTLADGREIDDPRITPELAVQLNYKAKHKIFQNALLHSLDEAKQLTQMALNINEIYKNILKEVGWTLEDFKFEVGVDPTDATRQFILIDEISPDCSRIRDRNGCSLTKDLFRQKKSESEIYEGYRLLKEHMEHTYAAIDQS